MFTSHEYLLKFMVISHWILRKWKTFQTNVVEKIKTHILYSIISPENCDVWEVMWKNMVQPDGPQMTVYGAEEMQWYTLMIHTILIASSLQNCLREGAAMFRYTHIACLVSLWAQDPGLSTRKNTRVVTTEISGTASILNLLFLAFLHKHFSLHKVIRRMSCLFSQCVLKSRLLDAEFVLYFATLPWQPERKIRAAFTVQNSV